MSILFELQHSKQARGLLHVPQKHDTSEWVVIAAYYSMYMAASSVLATLNYRSKSHAATIVALETFLVKKQLLEPKYIKMIEEARLNKEDVEQLRIARERREMAQYSPTKETTREIARQMRKDAYRFVERMARLLR